MSQMLLNNLILKLGGSQWPKEEEFSRVIN